MANRKPLGRLVAIIAIACVVAVVGATTVSHLWRQNRLRAEAASKAKQEELRAQEASRQVAQKVEADRLRQAEASRLAEQHAETERQRMAELDRQAKLRAEEDRLRQAEAKRLAEQQAETERQRRAELDREAKLQAERDAVEQKRLAEEAKAAELKAYKARYLGQQPKLRKVAVLIVDEDGRQNSRLSDAFVSLLNSNGIDGTGSFFTSEFVADGLWAEAYGGSKAASDKLELSQLVELLLLGRQTVEYSTNAALNDLVTAHMTLRFRTLPLKGGSQEHVADLESVGAELGKPLPARTLAEERLIKQLQGSSETWLAKLKPAFKQP